MSAGRRRRRAEPAERAQFGSIVAAAQNVVAWANGGTHKQQLLAWWWCFLQAAVFVRVPARPFACQLGVCERAGRRDSARLTVTVAHREKQRQQWHAPHKHARDSFYRVTIVLYQKGASLFVPLSLSLTTCLCEPSSQLGSTLERHSQLASSALVAKNDEL